MRASSVTAGVGACFVVALAFAGCDVSPRAQIVCHLSAGNPGEAREISVPADAVPAYLAHGDHLGPCEASGSCAGRADGAPCDDGDQCTLFDVCRSGTCSAGEPVVCNDRGACQTAGVCDSSTGTCHYAAVADGTSCDDGFLCTRDTCQAGVCVGRDNGDLSHGETKTFSCPLEADAVEGLVQPTTCDFPSSLAFNNLFTGRVSLISHLERSFAGFDVNTLPDGRLQVSCVYRNSDGLQIGGTTTLTTAATCTPTATSFVCTR